MYKIFTVLLAFFCALLLLSLRSGRISGSGFRRVAIGTDLRAGAAVRVAGNVKRPADVELIGCGPISAGTVDIQPDAEGRYAPVFPGWGHHHYPVSTTNDSAQFFFDQGLSLYYGYHLTESYASFKEAARRDSTCAILYWGQALALGPYYNNSYTYKAPLTVQTVITRMTQLALSASPKERDLIAAVGRRYDTDTSDRHRVQLNQAYSDDMRELIGKYPGDPDVKALYIDGVMIEHAWDMWEDPFKPRPWTPELEKYCNEILAIDSVHPAALHYYIHIEEASGHASNAFISAERLQASMPGVAHMVHMASHMYQRVNSNKEGVIINDRAVAAQNVYDSIARGLKLVNTFSHYYAVQATCAMNGGMYEKGIEAANHCKEIMAGNPASLATRAYSQFLYSMPLFVQVRMGYWKGILETPVPDGALAYASILSDFARGMAFLRTGRMEEAHRCLNSLRGRLNDPILLTRRLPFSPAIEGAKVAEALLSGEILFVDGKQQEAFDIFSKAIDREGKMVYAEPKEWPLPVRQYAGLCLLKAGRTQEALTMYARDLEMNPGNGWAKVGRRQCHRAQNKPSLYSEGAAIRHAFYGGTVPSASAY